MKLINIPPQKLISGAYALWEDQWLLLTSGDFEEKRFNAMTVSWGSLGVMWNRPFAQVVVRPTRYTFEFMEKYETFTLCAFPMQYRPALQLLGARSGRDSNKMAECGLTAVAASQVGAPAYAEAELVIECQKIYWQDFDPDHFLDPKIGNNYAGKDYHRVYYGQILAVSGIEQYLAAEAK
ncbi:MAG: flavin reductase [Longilinea sp.]|jgi:flavin reductase (DIM6/NTAB) family NADH-FMN oxidoreductase RutF|nr:flavin reductase [Longilinea sp.]HQF62845.1 flavin reductase [Anaerolineaceae bacterium]HQH85907.1 flavin reductase [Anaerolineaceae bacterium]